MTDSDHILCRMLIPMTELGRFDSMVLPFELEAYDILKSRSGMQRNALNNTLKIVIILILTEILQLVYYYESSY